MSAVRGWVLCLAGLLAICLLGTTVVRGQTAAATATQKPVMSEQAFKDIQVLRGIPVKEFIETGVQVFWGEPATGVCEPVLAR